MQPLAYLCGVVLLTFGAGDTTATPYGSPTYPGGYSSPASASGSSGGLRASATPQVPASSIYGTEGSSANGYAATEPGSPEDYRSPANEPSNTAVSPPRRQAVDPRHGDLSASGNPWRRERLSSPNAATAIQPEASDYGASIYQRQSVQQSAPRSSGQHSRVVPAAYEAVAGGDSPNVTSSPLEAERDAQLDPEPADNERVDANSQFPPDANTSANALNSPQPQPSPNRDRRLNDSVMPELAQAFDVRDTAPESRADDAGDWSDDSAAAVALSPPAADKSIPLSPPGGTKPDREGDVSPSGMPSMVTTVASLGIVLGLFLVLAWFMRRMSPAAAAVLPKEAVEVLGQSTLGGKQHVQLLRCGNKLLLVSVSAAGMETLTEVTDPIEVDRLAGLCMRARPSSATAAFRQVFHQAAQESAPPVTIGEMAQSPYAFGQPVSGTLRGHSFQEGRDG